MHHLSALLNGVGEDLKQDEVFWSVAGVNHQERFAWIEEEQQRRTLSRIPPPGTFLDSAAPKYGEEIDISSNVVRFGIAIAAVFVVTSVAFVITGVAEDAPGQVRSRNSLRQLLISLRRVTLVVPEHHAGLALSVLQT